MKGLPPELIYVLIFAAIIIFQFVMKRFGPQPPPESAQPEELPQYPEEIEQEYQEQEYAPAAATLPSAAAEHFGRREATVVPTPPARRRFSPKALLANKRQVQNAVVLAAIIGPCRAYEPHDIR